MKSVFVIIALFLPVLVFAQAEKKWDGNKRFEETNRPPSTQKITFPPNCVLLGISSQGGLLLELPNGEKMILKEDNTLMSVSKSEKQKPPYDSVPLEFIGVTKEGTPVWKETDGTTVTLNAAAKGGRKIRELYVDRKVN